jgi:hypothetical protein
MNDPDEGVAHHDGVEIGGREGSGKLRTWLISQADDIAERVCGGEAADLFELHAPACKTERDVLTMG